MTRKLTGLRDTTIIIIAALVTVSILTSYKCALDAFRPALKRLWREEIAAAPFPATYVSARHYPHAALTTYITTGQRPSWKVEKNEKIVHLPVPHADPFITNYKRKDLLNFLSTMQNITNHTPENYKQKNFHALKALEAKWGPKIKLMFNDWLSLTKGSPETPKRSVPDLMYHLNILLNKVDPAKRWTLKCDGCFKNDYETIVDPKNACAGNNDIDVVTLVTSVPKGVESRRAIRETWGTWTNNNTSNFRLIFLFGEGWSEAENQILESEGRQYGDILQESYHDSYYNLTQKVISGYKWVLRACSRAKFIMRSAEDGFVYLPEVLGLIQTSGNHPRLQNYQIGKCFVNFRPHRWPDYKGYLSTDDYADHIFPPYALGTSFLTSMNLTKKIVDKSKDINYIPIEDSYFGLVLREINSGCLHVAPFPPAGDALSAAKKYEIFKYIQKNS